MALEPLKIVKNWFKNSTTREVNWDEIADKISAFASRVNNNLKQVGVDLGGEDYDYNNQGKGTQTSPVVTRLSALESPRSAIGTENISLDISSQTTVKLVQADGNELSTTLPGKATFNATSNIGELVTRNIESAINLVLTGCHWGLDSLGDVSDRKLWILLIDTGASVVLGVDATGGRETVTPADAETIATSVSSIEKVFVNSAITSENNCIYLGWVKADFDDTGHAGGENYWTIQTDVGDINVGRGEIDKLNETIDGDLNVEGDIVVGDDLTVGGIVRHPLTNNNGIQKLGLDLSDTSVVELAYEDGTALSSSQVGYISIRDSSNPEQVARRAISANMSVTLTGAHWGLDTLGDRTDFKLYIILIDNAGTPTLGVTILPRLTYVPTADVVTAAASATTYEKVLCSSAVAADSCCTYLGCINADFDDTGGASENLWTIQTGIGDLELATNISKDKEVNSIVGPGGVAVSSSTGSYSMSSTTQADVTNASVTITTSGRPVVITLKGSYVGVENNTDQNCSAYLEIDRGGTTVETMHLYYGDPTFTGGGLNWHLNIPPGCVSAVDEVSAGTYTYKLQAQVTSTNTSIKVNQCYLVVYEL